MKFDFFITYLLDLTFDIVIAFSLFFLLRHINFSKNENSKYINR